ncbi:FecR family protein, partial [Streptomyces sp. P5_D11]
KAQAIWDGPQVAQCAQSLAARPAKVTVLARLRPHWKPLATAAVLLLGLFSFSSLPMRLQADHQTVVGERQRLQLEDGSRVLLNTNSAFSSTINDQQRVARLYQGEAFFEVQANRGQPLEIDAGPVTASVRDTAFAVRYLDGVAQVRV